MRHVASLVMKLAAVTLATLVASCTTSLPTIAPTTTPQVQEVPSTGPAADVDVTVRSPMRLRYVAQLLGASKPALSVVVTNRSVVPLDVTNLRVHLNAERQGVAFPCAKVVGPEPAAREPRTLAPGGSYEFDRLLDCALPLIGTYAVRVGVSFGNDAWSTGRNVRAFTLSVAALANVGPREIENRPGLWASVGVSDTLTGAGRGRTVMALVNATAKPIEVPRMRLAFRVYRAGGNIACEDEPAALGSPAVLGAGETYREPVDLSCIGLSVAGRYEIRPRLIVSDGANGDREIRLGTSHMEVFDDPSIGVQWPRKRN